MSTTILKEQIGLDRIIIDNLTVVSIDIDKLLQVQKIASETDANKVVIENYYKNSGYQGPCYRFSNGDHCSKIEINDNNMFGTLLLNTKKIKKRVKDILYQRLEIFINNQEFRNSQNQSVKQFKIRLDRIITYIKSVYGIELSLEYAEYNTLEINKTFVIDKEFLDYDKALRVMLENMPPTYEIDNTGRYVAKHGSCQFKIYDKASSINKFGQIDIRTNIMRIEFVLQKSKIENDFKTLGVSDISDADIMKIYLKLIDKIFDNLEKWKKEYKKELRILYQDSIAVARNDWMNDLLSKINNFENEIDKGTGRRKIFLISPNDIIDLVSLDKTKKKHKSRTVDTLWEKLSTSRYSYLKQDVWEQLDFIEMKAKDKEITETEIEYIVHVLDKQKKSTKHR